MCVVYIASIFGQDVSGVRSLYPRAELGAVAEVTWEGRAQLLNLRREVPRLGDLLRWLPTAVLRAEVRAGDLGCRNAILRSGRESSLVQQNSAETT